MEALAVSPCRGFRSLGQMFLVIQKVSTGVVPLSVLREPDLVLMVPLCR